MTSRPAAYWWEILKLGVLLLAFAAAFWQYRADQRWRRIEFFAQQMAQLDANPGARNARLMLDFDDAGVCFPSAQTAGPKCLVVTDSMLVAALVTGRDSTALTPDEQYIVSSFDELFDALERIDYLLAQGYLDDEAAEHPSLLAWVGLLGYQGETASEKRLKAALCAYVESLDYAGVRDLMTRYIPPEEMACTSPYFLAPARPRTVRTATLTNPVEPPHPVARSTA